MRLDYTDNWHLPWWLVCNKLKRLERPLMRPPDALVLLPCRQLTPIVDIDKGQKDLPPWHFGAKKAPPIWASWLLDYFVDAEEIWIPETSHDRHYNFPAKEETKKIRTKKVYFHLVLGFFCECLDDYDLALVVELMLVAERREGSKKWPHFYFFFLWHRQELLLFFTCRVGLSTTTQLIEV